MLNATLLSLTLLIGTPLTATSGPVLSQVNDTSCRTEVMIDKEVNEALPDGILAKTQWTGKYSSYFIKAYAEITGQAPPPMDTIDVRAVAEGVLITAFNGGCFVGAVRLPFPVYVAIRNKMEEYRGAQN